MNLFEKTMIALSYRPLLWLHLTETQQYILHSRMHNQAYTAIGQTMPDGKLWSASLVKKAEEISAQMILHHEKIAIKLDKDGYGNRYGRIYGRK